MTELELLTRMRSEVPLLPPGPRLEDALAHQPAGRSVRMRTVRIRGLRARSSRGVRARLLIACTAVAAAAVAGGLVATRPAPVPGPVTQAWSGRPAAPVSVQG